MNTIADTAYRAKWFSTMLQESLKYTLVAEKICAVDRTENMFIWNPFGSVPTTVVQAIATVTYTPAAYTATVDTLTISDVFVVSEQIYDFERLLAIGDLLTSRRSEMEASVKRMIDKWVLNELCERGTGTYDTPVGGFAAANVGEIVANLVSKSAGFEIEGGWYLVIEQTDLPGVLLYESLSGFNYADTVLSNGFVRNIMGVDIYVVASGTFVDAAQTGTSGSKTWTNAGHRVAGIKGIATYAAPRGIVYNEKTITGYLGVEIEMHGFVGFNAWYAKRTMTIDITVK
jgi:hypothetical protein